MSGTLKLGLSAIAAALLAALILPGEPVGVNLSIVSMTVVAAAFLSREEPLLWQDKVLVALALVLCSVGVVRAAPWLIAACLMGGAAVASVAVTGSRAWLQVLTAPLGWLLGAIEGTVAVLSPVWSKGRALPVASRAAIRTVMTTTILLVVFGTLFVTADAAFARLANGLLSPDVDISLLPARIAIGAIVLAATGALAYMVQRGPIYEGTDPFASSDRRDPTRSEVLVPLAVLDALFTIFVAIQLVVLFGGRRYVLSTMDLTFAEYARRGFFQLVAVGAIALVVVAWAWWRARASDDHTKRMLKGLLAGLCVLTLVVLASSLERLSLYEDTYGFTLMRLLPHAAALWMGGIFALVLAAGTTLGGSWLPRAVVAYSAIFLIGFAAINPEGFVAARNVERFADSGRIDIGYLSTLGPDALPALEPLKAQLVCPIERMRAELAEDDPRLSFNFARDDAREVLAEIPPTHTDSSCGGNSRYSDF